MTRALKKYLKQAERKYACWQSIESIEDNCHTIKDAIARLTEPEALWALDNLDLPPSIRKGLVAKITSFDTICEALRCLDLSHEERTQLQKRISLADIADEMLWRYGSRAQFQDDNIRKAISIWIAELL